MPEKTRLGLFLDKIWVGPLTGCWQHRHGYSSVDWAMRRDVGYLGVRRHEFHDLRQHDFARSHYRQGDWDHGNICQF